MELLLLRRNEFQANLLCRHMLEENGEWPFCSMFFNLFFANSFYNTKTATCTAYNTNTFAPFAPGGAKMKDPGNEVQVREAERNPP